MGYKIPVTRFPQFTGVHITPPVGQLLEEATTFSQKGAIEEVQSQISDSFYSMHFLVSKKNRDLPPILNLNRSG